MSTEMLEICACLGVCPADAGEDFFIDDEELEAELAELDFN